MTDTAAGATASDTAPAVAGRQGAETMTKPYTIHNTGNSMIIADSDTGDHIAEYALTYGRERRDIAAMRRQIDRHLRQPGATLGNYQW
jgi:hypothetical protein